MPAKTGGTTRRRRYESAARRHHAAQNRAAVVDAARRLFGANGWAATGMREIAREAGVSVETVYAHFGSKPEVLAAAVDVAVVGDAAPVPLRERPEFAAMGRGPRAARARAAAHLVRDINERISGVARALREAAAADADLAARLREGEERRREDVTEAAPLVAGRAVTAVERDGIWALLSVEVYQLLVERSGWTADIYEEWLADMLGRVTRPTKGG